jgi:hypothetical protein
MRSNPSRFFGFRDIKHSLRGINIFSVEVNTFSPFPSDKGAEIYYHTEGKFLVSDQPHSKLITFSYLIRRELFSRNFYLPPNSN